MTGLDNLRAIAQGRRPDHDGLLGSARFAWGQSELLGEEAIIASFGAHPFDLSHELLSIETPTGACLIGENHAIVADLYDGRIGRLWRVGEELEEDPEAAIDVAFDTDLRQERGALNFRAEDHPDLHSAAAENLLLAAADLVEKVRIGGKLRVRAFVLRAFGSPDSSAALISLFTLDNETTRSASFAYAVVGTSSNAQKPIIIYQPTQARSWTPRL